MDGGMRAVKIRYRPRGAPPRCPPPGPVGLGDRPTQSLMAYVMLEFEALMLVVRAEDECHEVRALRTGA